jgi:hypothetical protein
MAGFSKPLLLVSTHPMFGSYNPRRQVFWFRLVPFRSPLLRESRLISFPRGNEMFQFPPFASPSLCIQEGILKVYLSGFPHSEISGSKVICTSPKLIAACRVLHRRQMPRHPPCALVYFQLHLQSFGKVQKKTEVFFCLPIPTTEAEKTSSDESEKGLRSALQCFSKKLQELHHPLTMSCDIVFRQFQSWLQDACTHKDMVQLRKSAKRARAFETCTGSARMNPRGVT